MSKKYGLIFAGGGAKGAFSAGVAKAFSDAGVEIGCIAGTSVGAIVGACLATGKIDDLITIFETSQGQKTFFKRWPFPWLWRAWNKKAIFDNRPIVDKARAILSEDALQQTRAKFACAATNIDTGDLTVFSNQTHVGQMVDGVLASAALPPAFEPVVIATGTYVDGGLREGIPAKLAVDLDPTCDEFILILPSKGMLGIPDVPFQKLSPIDYALRLFDIMFSQIYLGNVSAGMSKYWNAEKFKIIEPSIQVVRDTLDFDPARATVAIAEGYKQGLDFLKN